jgi:hypothetical protein
MNHRTFAATVLAGAALLAAAGSASAQSTWNLYSGSANNREGVASGCSQNATNSNLMNNSYNCTVATSTPQALTVSAWSSNSDRGTSTGSGNQYSLSGSGFASSHLSNQGTSGFGGTSRTEAQSAFASGDTTPLDPNAPNHAFDSVAPGNFDMLMLDFGSSSVILDQIGIGWTGGDADLMVMRWTGSTPPPRTTGTVGGTGGTGGNQNLNSTLWNSATPGTAGWQLVGTYGNLATDNSTPFGGSAVNTGANQASSWWLISAFNTTLLGTNTACATCDAGNDSFKFNFIKTRTPGSVPEPGTLALAMVAVGGIFAARRRRA